MSVTEIRVGDLVRVSPRPWSNRTVLIEVERVIYRDNGWVNVSGLRIRQKDGAKLSNIARCELRRSYQYVPVERVEIVKRGSLNGIDSPPAVDYRGLSGSVVR